MADAKPRKKTKAERTKELLYHTAMDMLIERGFQSTTIRDICREADVSVGTFYTYFDSKYAILFEVVRKADHYFVDEVQPRLEGLSSTREQLLMYFEEYAEYMQQTNFETLCVLYSVQNIWLARYRPMQRVLTAILTAGQLKGEVSTEYTPEKLCDMLISSVRGIVFSWCTMQAGFVLTERIEEYIRFVMKSFLTESQPEAQGALTGES